MEEKTLQYVISARELRNTMRENERLSILYKSLATDIVAGREEFGSIGIMLISALNGLSILGLNDEDAATLVTKGLDDLRKELIR